jgi:hypothetical protein
MVLDPVGPMLPSTLPGTVIPLDQLGPLQDPDGSCPDCMRIPVQVGPPAGFDPQSWRWEHLDMPGLCGYVQQLLSYV